MKYLTAVKAYDRLRDRVAESPALLAVLDIHGPQGYGYGPSDCVVCCAECYPGNGCDGWPCGTATAIINNT